MIGHIFLPAKCRCQEAKVFFLTFSFQFALRRISSVHPFISKTDNYRLKGLCFRWLFGELIFLAFMYILHQLFWLWVSTGVCWQYLSYLCIFETNFCIFFPGQNKPLVAENNLFASTTTKSGSVCEVYPTEKAPVSSQGDRRVCLALALMASSR